MFLSHTAELRELPRDRSFVAAEAAVTEAGDAIMDLSHVRKLASELKQALRAGGATE